MPDYKQEEQLNPIFNPVKLNIAQLHFPLDPISRRIIKDILIFPINTSLPGTSAATQGNYGVFFTNNTSNSWEIERISESHTTAGSDGGTVSLQVERLQGAEAPDSGDLLLSTAFNLKGTANTVQHGDLSSNKSLLIIQQGDRLCLRDSGTTTAVAGVNVSVFLKLLE